MTWPTAPKRYICIDLGDKRTGLAVGDAATNIVSPLKVLEVPINHDRGEALLSALAEAIAAHGAAEVVVGLPLIKHDQEGPRAKIVRAFIDRLRPRLTPQPPFHFHDETLSTAAADWSMSRSGMTRGEKKLRRDALAAAVILRDFLASIGSSTSHEEHGGISATDSPPAKSAPPSHI